VILFDGRGQLVSKSYAFQCHVDDPTDLNNTWLYTAMARLLYGIGSTLPNVPSPTSSVAWLKPTHNDLIPVLPAAPGEAIRSQIGFVLFNPEEFKNQGFTDADYEIDNTLNLAKEQEEELWLDKNAVPVLINRFNGTLIAGE
jgi:hypothetical protein